MVSFFHTPLFLCVFVATWALPQNPFIKSECPESHCSTNYLEDFKGDPCLKLNEETVYRCQKFKCVNMTVSGNTLQPGEKIGCYNGSPNCVPFKLPMNQMASQGPDRMGCFCDKHNGALLIICQ